MPEGRHAPNAEDPPEDVAVLTERFAKRLGQVSVPRNLGRAHPLIEKLLAKDEEIRQKKATERFYWREPQFETPFERRRLRILTAIFSAFAKVGCSSWLRGDGARELCVKVGNVAIMFTLDRPTNRRGDRFRHPPSENTSAETLVLSIEAYQPPPGVTLAWKDEKDSPLEDRMTEVVLGMAIAAEHLHRESVKRHLAWERERREAAERKERLWRKEVERKEQERIAALKKARVDALLADAESLERAARLRSYVDTVLAMPPADTTHEVLQVWAAFVRQQADALDPLTSGRLKASIQEALAASAVPKAGPADSS
ncbi:MAG: hypothetical protein ACR650_12620 [Methylocystis sp.]